MRRKSAALSFDKAQEGAVGKDSSFLCDGKLVIVNRIFVFVREYIQGDTNDVAI